MFRIRRIFDDSLAADQTAIAQVKIILAERFPTLEEQEFADLTARLKNPMGFRFRSLLFVAEDGRGKVHGFAMVLHDPQNAFVFLDYIATDPTPRTSGVGGALYESLRDEAKAMKAEGLFFECLPDDRDECEDDATYRANVARLRFYERHGARPVVGTGYELPSTPGRKGMPHLVYDDLDSGHSLPRSRARKIVRAILENRYLATFEEEYVKRVADSFRDDPVRIREPRYRQKERLRRPRFENAPVDLVINTEHDIHHVRDRGYVEAPARVRAIEAEFRDRGALGGDGSQPIFRSVTAHKYPRKHILAVHDRGYVDYFQRVCKDLPEGKSVYPYVFPIRNRARPPQDMSVRAGYYCIDTFTPLNRNALLAATRAVDCALTAADQILEGSRVAYALVRPPGHHAERDVFGGFCYFNNTAIAAHHLSATGRVAILDLDYHHGNGQQSIFYERNDVLTISIHGHPRFAYPYFSGYNDERGGGAGEGYNINLPQPESLDGQGYRRVLTKALRHIKDFDPTFVVLALGLDTAKSDPTGTWSLRAEDFRRNGLAVGGLGRPILVVQEGGYRTRTLGTNALSFFSGLVESVRLSRG